uniref:Uncharacterized protein n=1 Tax=Echeneis naucrates TaxID=173247 RepID=A0A665W6U2_ECHNA
PSGPSTHPCLLSLVMEGRCDPSAYGNIYKYQANTLNGSHTVNFREYIGRSILFVNVATY